MWVPTFTIGNCIKSVNVITLFNSTNFCSTYFVEYADTEARGEIQIFPDFLRISAETRRMVTIARL